MLLLETLRNSAAMRSRLGEVHYIVAMPSAHHVLEVKTARESLFRPEAAVQVFSTLPRPRDRWWWQLVGQNERLSFEILASKQLIRFSTRVPDRLSQYFEASIRASYPDAEVSTLETDPLLELPQDSPYWRAASLRLKNHSSLPLKSFREFSDVDPLNNVLSTLSQVTPDDHILIQFLVRPNTGSGIGLSFATGSSTEAEAGPQKSLIERKQASQTVTTAIRVLVYSTSHERSHLLLESIVASLQGMTQSTGNQIVGREPWFFASNLKQRIFTRTWGFTPQFPLTVEELATLYHYPNQKVSHIPNLAWGKHIWGEPPEDLPIVTSDMPKEAKREINPYAKTLFKNAPAIYGLRRPDRRRHLYVIGKTGTGKSTLLANMAINDLKNNEGLCVIDPHGDLVETLLNYIPSHRINDVVYFDPADPERTIKINLFEGENVAHRELIASGIVAIFQKLYAYSWGPRLEHILRNSLLTLLKTPQAKLSDVVELLTNAKYRAQIVEQLDDDILRSFWINEFDSMQDRQRNEAVAPILNKVGQFVSSPLVRDVVNASKSSFSIEEIMNQGKILLVNLSQGRLGEDNATMLGAMLITKIQLAAMSRVDIPEEDRRDFYLYVDEFQNFATQSFNKILSEARKYRLNLILANQYIAQIPEDVQKAIFGNCGSMISFVMGADDAQAFMKEYGDKYTHDDLVSLGKYQIINKIAIDNIISRPFPAHTLSLAKSFNQNRDKVIKVSRERYAKKKG